MQTVLPSRERIFYECLEGKFHEHASHTDIRENNYRVTRAMLSSSIRCNTYFDNDQKQFPDSQSIYSNMYRMMLTAQGEASTPVAGGTSPEERGPPFGVELYRSVTGGYYIPPDTGSPTTLIPNA